MGLYVRYWIPIAAVLVLAILPLVRGFVQRRWVRPAVVGTTLAVAGLVVRSQLQQFQPGLLARTAFGQGDRTAFLVEYQPLFPLYEAANRELPQDSRILLSEYCSGFYVDRTTFCADHLQDSLRFSDWGTFNADLHQLGITHVIAPTNTGPATARRRHWRRSCVDVGALQEDQKNQLVARLISTHGQLIAQATDHGLYAIDPQFVAAQPTAAH